MADIKTNLLVTLVFDENTDILKQVDTECAVKAYIRNGLQRAIIGKEIKHFVIADDEVINDKLKDERKKGKWEFVGDNCFRCTKCGEVYTLDQLNHINNYCDGRFPKGCPNCASFRKSTITIIIDMIELI